MTTFDDLVAKLREARTEIEHELASIDVRHRQLEAEMFRIDGAISALDGAPAGEVAAIRPVRSVPAIAPARKRGPAKGSPSVGDPAKGGEAVAARARARWEEVFNWVVRAKADGTYSLNALEAKFGTYAKNWRACCAKYGMTLDDTPAAAPAAAAQPVPTAKGAKVLACDDCDATFEIHQAAALNTHTIAVHGRRATTTERQPIANSSAA